MRMVSTTPRTVPVPWLACNHHMMNKYLETGSGSSHLFDGAGDGSEGDGAVDNSAVVSLTLAQVQLGQVPVVMEGRSPAPGDTASALASPRLPGPTSARLRLLEIHLSGLEVEVEVWRILIHFRLLSRT